MYFQVHKLLFTLASAHCSPYYDKSSSYRQSRMLILNVVEHGHHVFPLACDFHSALSIAHTGHHYVLTCKQARQTRKIPSRWLAITNLGMEYSEKIGMGYVAYKIIIFEFKSSVDVSVVN